MRMTPDEVAARAARLARRALWPSSVKVRGVGPERGRAAKTRETGLAAGASESQSQVAFFDWVRPYLRTRGIAPSLCYAVPNGAHLAGDARMRAIQMARLKREGLTAGVLDINLDVPKIARLNAETVTLFHGLRIEMKAASNKPTPEQAAHILALRQAGYNVVICYSADAAILAVKAYLEG